MKMDKTLIILLLLSLLSCYNKSVYSLDDVSKKPSNFSTKESPFTARASVIRYWNAHISNNLSISPFLLSKASPLSPAESAFFVKLAAEESLSSHLPAFCSAADLFCLLGSGMAIGKHASDSNFAHYMNKQFSNYGNDRLSGVDQFKNYSDSVNFATSAFARYSRASTGHREGFTGYAGDGNVASSNFTSYSSNAAGGSGDFTNYLARVNVPDLRFTSYDSGSNGHRLSFGSYSDNTNSGSQSFAGYGKNGNAAPAEFTSYGSGSNVVGSTFTGYGELANSGNDSFKGYTTNANNPKNGFRNYGLGGNAGTDNFVSYRDSANAGSDTFQSYGKKSSSERANFVNYGNSFNIGSDMFKEYGKGAIDQAIGFKIYGVNNTFKDYAKKGVTFAGYTKPGDQKPVNGKTVNHRIEEGKFFRESLLKQGSVMRMPNIQDWMPKRSFLPRAIASRLSLSSARLPELKRVFQVGDNSTMEHVMANALAECEREPSPGETKQCVGTIEDMIDFVTSILGHNVVVRTTENVNGSSQDVILGPVKGLNGGRVTKSVSCHQSLYPYLLYYCHSVPKVRVYEADILDARTPAAERINHGIAICHLDTSAWSPSHGAFSALGAGPGLIEVCHWIFENDMTWITTD